MVFTTQMKEKHAEKNDKKTVETKKIYIPYDYVYVELYIKIGK